MVVRTHNLPTGLLNNDFFEVDEAIYQRVNWPYEQTFRFRRIEKIELDEVV
jgi:hypothetical protein